MPLRCPWCSSSNVKQSHLNRRGYVCQDCWGGFMLGISLKEKEKEKEMEKEMENFFIKEGCDTLTICLKPRGIWFTGKCEAYPRKEIGLGVNLAGIKNFVQWLNAAITELEESCRRHVSVPPGLQAPGSCPICRSAGHYYVEHSSGHWERRDCLICNGMRIQPGDEDC